MKKEQSLTSTLGDLTTQVNPNPEVRKHNNALEEKYKAQETDKPIKRQQKD